MGIEINGYFDRNLGDDLMIKAALDNIDGSYLNCQDKSMTVPFGNAPLSGSADIKLRVSGSCFLVPNNKALLYRMKEVYLGKHKCPHAVISCNISPFINRISEYVIKKQISELQLITVRDSFSYEYITDHVKNVRCEFFHDLVFSVPVPSHTGQHNIGITAYNKAGSEGFDKLAKVADRYIKDTGCNVILFAFDTGIEDDTKAAREIFFRCRYKEKIKISAHNGNGQNILNDLSSCSKLIASRHHGIVLGLRMGIGVVPLIYSDKSLHMLNDLGFCDQIFSIDNFNADEIYQSLENTSYRLNKNVIYDAENHIRLFKKIFLEGV